MTHDECSTFFNFVLPNRSLFDLLLSSDCWQNANNHLVNTLLMQASVTMFGESEWALRLPNWLAHIAYLGASGALVSVLVRHRGWRLAAFAILNVNPFLLDFFAVARGYGLSVGFIMLAIWALRRFSEQASIKNTALIFSFTTLAVWSNFTALDFMAALWVVFLGLLWSAPTAKIKFQNGAVAAIISLICVAVIARPIQYIRARGEFGYGQKDLGLMFREVFGDWMYGAKPFGVASDLVCCYTFSVVLGGWFLWLVWRKFFGQSYSRFGLVAVSLVWVITLVMVARHILTGADFLSHRTALQLMPILGLPFALAINELSSRKNIFGWVATFVVLLGLGLLLRGRISVKTCREWYYDINTPDMMHLLADRIGSRPTTLGVHWLFRPSTMYYRRKLGLEQQLVIEETSATPDTTGRFDYYFVENAQAFALGVPNAYRSIQGYGIGQQLLESIKK